MYRLGENISPLEKGQKKAKFRAQPSTFKWGLKGVKYVEKLLKTQLDLVNDSKRLEMHLENCDSLSKLVF